MSETHGGSPSAGKRLDEDGRLDVEEGWIPKCGEETLGGIGFDLAFEVDPQVRGRDLVILPLSSGIIFWTTLPLLLV